MRMRPSRLVKTTRACDQAGEALTVCGVACPIKPSKAAAPGDGAAREGVEAQFGTDNGSVAALVFERGIRGVGVLWVESIASTLNHVSGIALEQCFGLLSQGVRGVAICDRIVSKGLGNLNVDFFAST
jgi:hypothetical protein